MNALAGGNAPLPAAHQAAAAQPFVAGPVPTVPLTAEQIADLQTHMRGGIAQRPTQAELDALPPDQAEDQLRKFYLNQHEGDEPEHVEWRKRRAAAYCIRDHEGRYYHWDIYMASDPMNEERPIAEFHDDALHQQRLMAQAAENAAAEAEAAAKAAEERAIQARVEAINREARIEAEAQRRAAEQRAAGQAKQPPKGKGKQEATATQDG